MIKFTPEQLVTLAEKMKVGKPRELGYKDNKMSVTLEDFMTLFEAGADVIRANAHSFDSPYYFSEAMYKGYKFTTTSEEPIKKLNM